MRRCCSALLAHNTPASHRRHCARDVRCHRRLLSRAGIGFSQLQWQGIVVRATYDVTVRYNLAQASEFNGYGGTAENTNFVNADYGGLGPWWNQGSHVSFSDIDVNASIEALLEF